MKILIPVIVGAIIGYFTNWLAIKMLFRPHYEKKIFGIKVPFTPGLIPKERDRIAKSIGETVGVYLLSPETIIESLANKRIDKEIKSWLESKISTLKENQQSIKDFLVNILDENYNIFIKTIEESFEKIIISQIRGEQFKSLIFKSIESKVNNINPDKIYGLIDEKLREFLFEFANSSEVKDGLINQIKLKLDEFSQDDRKLSALIPEDILAAINQYIDENGNDIGNTIRQSFKDPIVQRKIKESISDLVSQNIPKMIMAFISPDTISDKIFHMIEKYVDSEDANKNIIMIIKSSIDKLLESKVSHIAPKVGASFEEIGFSKIVDNLIGYVLHEENYNSLSKLVQNKLKKSEIENKEKIIWYLNNNIDIILNSNELEETISIFIKDIIDQFLNKPISSMVSKIDSNTITSIYNFIRVIFDKFAVHELPSIIELFNISKIVEDKVNGFSVDFAEELILEIANKELKAITWLGALLGGLLGVLTPLIQMLY